MVTVPLQVPEDVLASSAKTAEKFGRDVLTAAVVKWYESGEISQGRGAEILGLTRLEFLLLISRFKVSIWQITPEEIAAELASAR
jgi:predicted HTH domain antitoxin